MKKTLFTLAMAASMLLSLQSFADRKEPGDSTKTRKEAEPPENWFNLHKSSDQVQGVSTEEAYNTVLKGKKASKKIVVAVIDSGVDIEHEDLQGKIWVNSKEIAGNAKDDDGNGYVDDINGWNFIGGKNGEHVNHDTYEITRIYARLKPKYENKKESEISKKDLEEFKIYQEAAKTVEEKRNEMRQQLMGFSQFYMMYKQAAKSLKAHFGKETFTKEDVQGLETEDASLKEAAGIVQAAYGYGLETEEDMDGVMEYFKSSLEYGYNPDFESRTTVGDNYDDKKERIYGNNSVEGPDAEHGTHVAGIIAANRNNNLGMKGVAENVEIMVIRTVPNGDERDKDVANAIRYAADNGAHIINMSFGKAYSPYKEIVDDAVRYAEKKGLLLIHAAGNDAKNIDEENNFPNDNFLKKGKAENWIEVGASSWGDYDNFVANFSNYGQTQVDIFAPGVDIYSTVPEQGYKANSGTSMAAPVVAGVAALVWSYYPELSAKELKEVLLKSAIPFKGQKVNMPGSEKEKIDFAKLSVTGGIVNALEALKLAEKMTKK